MERIRSFFSVKLNNGLGSHLLKNLFCEIGIETDASKLPGAKGGKQFFVSVLTESGSKSSILG
jgi:hypothetical protein